MLPSWVYGILAMGALNVITSLVCLCLGFKRGREVERMEPPPNGVWHFRDGWIRQMRAESPVIAIERLIASAGGR